MSGMQAVRRGLAQGWQRVGQMKRDRRVKVVVGLVVIVCLLLLAIRLLPVSIYPDICADWKKERAQSPGQQNPEMWWHKLCRLEEEMEKTDYDCRDQRWMGNRYVCFDFNLVPPDRCLVYSFGIAYNFQFDDAMADYGCTVYSFDPSMSDSDHQHAERVYFKQLGLSGTDADHFVPRKDSYITTNATWRMRRLTSIMKQLGHSQDSLTIVKIDIESYEWDVMEDMLAVEGLLDSLPQLIIEWHLFRDTPPRSRYDNLISIYFQLKNLGFHTFHSNPESREHRSKELLRTQSETSWVNERFLRSVAPPLCRLGLTLWFCCLFDFLVVLLD